MSVPATPHGSTSAHTSLPATGAATPALPPQPAASALPPPATFDILPDLHKLLSRLMSASAQPPAPTPTPGQPVDEDGPLDPKNLASEAQRLRNKIQKAQRAVMALPDIDRSVEDQEEEIEDLEARIARLKTALQGLGQPTRTLKAEDEDTSSAAPDCMDSLFLALAGGASWYAQSTWGFKDTLTWGRQRITAQYDEYLRA